MRTCSFYGFILIPMPQIKYRSLIIGTVSSYTFIILKHNCHK